MISKKLNTADLTPRQIEILVLLSKGLRYEDIASELGITLGTTKQHVHMIYKKLRVKNSVEGLNLWFEE